MQCIRSAMDAPTCSQHYQLAAPHLLTTTIT